MNNLFQQMQQNQINSTLNNPKMQQIMDLVRQSGKSPKQLFMDECKNRGVDPESILSRLR